MKNGRPCLPVRACWSHVLSYWHFTVLHSQKSSKDALIHSGNINICKTSEIMGLQVAEHNVEISRTYTSEKTGTPGRSTERRNFQTNNVQFYFFWVAGPIVQNVVHVFHECYNAARVQPNCTQVAARNTQSEPEGTRKKNAGGQGWLRRPLSSLKRPQMVSKLAPRPKRTSE